MRAMSNFGKTALRVTRLIEGSATLHGTGRGRPRDQAADVLRGGVVLAVAGLDAYVIDAFVEALPIMAEAGRLGDEADRMLKPRALLGMLGEDDPLAALADAARQRFAAESFQNPSKIEEHLRKYLGYQMDWSSVAEKLDLRSGEEAKAELGKYVHRRNQIAHAGDIASGGNRASPIGRPFVHDCLAAVRATVQSLDDGLEREIAQATIL